MRMSPIEHIRKEILGVSQAELARIAQTSQPTVSRWEKGELEPSRAEMQLIREAVKGRALQWNDSWFFEAPLAPEVTAEISELAGVSS